MRNSTVGKELNNFFLKTLGSIDFILCIYIAYMECPGQPHIETTNSLIFIIHCSTYF